MCLSYCLLLLSLNKACISVDLDFVECFLDRLRSASCEELQPWNHLGSLSLFQHNFTPLPYLSLVIALRLCNVLCSVDLGKMQLNFFKLSHLGALTPRLSACLETCSFGQTLSLLWWTYPYEPVLLLKTCFTIGNFISVIVNLLV